MEQRANFLALCLLDAMEDENPKMIEDVLGKYDVDPNAIIPDRGIAPIHYSCGMPNIELAERTTAELLKRGADPNVLTTDNMTPMHVAAIHGRANIVKMLLEKGGKLDIVDDDRKTPILYAIHECHFDVVKTMQDYIFEQKFKQKQTDLSKTHSSKPLKNNLLTVNHLEEKKFTPNRINYNYDVTSPYYINITHRRKRDPCNCCTPSNDPDVPEPKVDENQENIFALTKENISELSKEVSSAPNTSPMSLIQAWREKVQRAKTKQSILEKFNDIDSLLSGIINRDELDFTNTVLDLTGQSDEEAETLKDKKEKSFRNTAFGKIIKTIEDAPTENDDTFYTVPDAVDPQAQSTQINSSTDFIRSPKNNEYIVQMTEAYVHTDDENGLVFYEKKLLNNQIARDLPNRNGDERRLDETVSSVSTRLTVPLDYETDALRAELTHFGDPPGPITKSTKKLYIKRLTKYKRNTSLMQAQLNANEENRTRFSVELDRTVHQKYMFDRIPEYLRFEKELSNYFYNNPNIKRLREGHLKQSFLYMLIDPRISSNLPGESTFMPKFEVWKRFVRAIFYVGKGKSTRPYSHLYDAMKQFSRKHDLENNKNSIIKDQYTLKKKLKSPVKKSTESKKIDRILEIWDDNKGVVCLHVFHNMVPTEAYTREAAIIDALSLEHLTNMKRGNYYGPPQTWTMRAKKYMGIALLFKAMMIYLAEGESQLSPSDLI